MGGGSGGDEAVDLAVAEQPLPAFFDHLVEIGPAGADLRSLWAVLHDGPVGADARARAVERDRNVGHQMDCSGPLVSGPLPQAARQFGDYRTAGRSAESGVPGAVFGEQRRHLGEPAVIQSKTVLRQDLADRFLFFDCSWHPSLLAVAPRMEII